MDFYGNSSAMPGYLSSAGANPYRDYYKNKKDETGMSKSGNRSASKSGDKDVSVSDGKSASKSDNMGVSGDKDKGASKSDDKSASKSDNRNGLKSDSKSTSKDDKKSASKSGVIRYNPKKNPYRIKKRLNYNMREISSQILRASKAQSASIVLVRARAKVGNLMRTQVTGQYNENEVRAALTHARSMVRVANKKLIHLREEEQEKRTYARKKVQRNTQRKREIKEAIESKKREIENAKRIEHMHEVQSEKRKRQELERKRRFHRSRELGKITEADLKYLKDQTDQKYENNTEYRYDMSGVVCSISASAAGLSELENEAMFVEAEIDAAMEAGAEMAADIADMGGAAFTGGAASVGASVDISL